MNTSKASVSAEDIGFDKKATSEYLLDTLKTCLKTVNNGREQIALLQKLSQAMQQHPSWFGNHKSKIEPFILRFLEEPDEKVAKEAAIAFHFFQQTGSAGVEGVNYSNNFLLAFKKLCATCQTLYDSFFESISEANHSADVDAEAYQLSALPSDADSLEVLSIYSRKIINCLNFIRAMIVKRYPVAKHLVLKYVVDIINRGLCFHICISGEESRETNHLATLLTTIQIHLLQLLRPLLLGCFSNIRTFSYIITRLLAKALKQCQQCDCLNDNLLYTKSVHSVLRDCLKLTKNFTQSHLHDSLIPLLLNDISLVKRQILLNPVGKKKNKKRKHRSVVPEIAPEMPVNKEAKEISCKSALETLKWLLQSPNLQPDTLKEVSGVITKILVDVQTTRAVHPYTDFDCQAALYVTFIALYDQNKLTSIPPLQLAVGILTAGMNNRANTKISQICRDGLNILEKISQPVCPSLYLYEGPSSNFVQRSMGDSGILVGEESLEFGVIDEVEEEENEDETIEKEDGVLEISEDIQNIDDDSDEVIEVCESDVKKVEEMEKVHVLSDILIQPPLVLDKTEADTSTPKFVSIHDALTQIKRNGYNGAQDTDEEEEGAEEPPRKRKKDDSDEDQETETALSQQSELDDGLDDMFSSFQDVVRE